jgi:hypothetical protein
MLFLAPADQTGSGKHLRPPEIKIQNRASCEALKYCGVLRRGVNVAAAF